jgi:hypothetical protein
VPLNPVAGTNRQFVFSTTSAGRRTTDDTVIGYDARDAALCGYVMRIRSTLVMEGLAEV